MAMKLSTTLSHITTVPSSSNSKIISEFYQYLKGIGTSESYQNQNFKAIIDYEVSKVLKSSSWILRNDCYIRKLNRFRIK